MAEAEGGAGPPAAEPAIDVHVHLHPPRLAQAIQSAFAAEGWINAHAFDPDQVVASLRRRGVERFCVFSYAHRPDMARDLNAWMAETAARYPEAIGLGTLHAGDADLPRVIDEALGLGLAGFKLHLSVQRFHVDDRRLRPLYERCQAEGHRLVLHVGTMPYRDPYTGVDRFRTVMAGFPRLPVCVAHMGAFETDAFLALTREYPHLYLDTTMALTPAARPYVGIDAPTITDEQLLAHQDRILFGSDFPLIPYDYEEERRWAWERGLPAEVRRKIFRDNARRFLGLA